MDATRERTVTLWDALAEVYDQVDVDFFAPIADGLVAQLAPQPGERGLDVGCGRGAVLLPLARAVGASGAALGVDLSPRMVEGCAALAADEGLAQVSTRVMDATRLDAPEVTGVLGGPADLVASSLVLFFLPDPAGALPGWVDTLRPRGRLGITTFAERSDVWEEVDALFEPYLPPQLLDARTSGARGRFATDAGVEGLLADAGLADVRTGRGRIPVRFADPEHWYRFSMSVGQRMFWLSVPEEERPTVKAAAFRVLGGATDPDGSVHLWQDVRYTVGVRP